MENRVKPLDAARKKALLDAHPDGVVLDVREEPEFRTGHLPGARNLPLDELDAQSARELLGGEEMEIFVYCRTGARSALAVERLRECGYQNIFDLGGLTGWPYPLE